MAEGSTSHRSRRAGKRQLVRPARRATPSTKAQLSMEWSYEVLDTKLARETKAATVLQLSLYSQLLEHAQGCAPGKNVGDSSRQ